MMMELERKLELPFLLAGGLVSLLGEGVSAIANVN
jgi:hypothetical protein